jgi:phage terminase large subunit-like protein
MSLIKGLNNWSIVYEKAIKEDGEPFFPEKLDKAKLAALRQTQGVYKFTNQYLNQVIPDEAQDFKKEWIKHYDSIPANHHTFMFIDPAISLMDGADFTATVVVSVDENSNWYVRMANRQRITATETIAWIFKVYNEFRPLCVGIEDVAYQKALLHFMAEEMHRRNTYLPLKGIGRSAIAMDGGKRSSNSKPIRIRSLVPRFEFGKILLNQGLDDLILEYSQFPRGAKDDLLDALASIEEIAFYPGPIKENTDVRNPSDPNYERNYIRSLGKTKKESFD